MAEKESKFTGKEVEYMANMLLSLKDGDFKNEMIDIPKFAKRCGVAEGSARNILARLRKKIAEQVEAEGNGVQSSQAEGKANKAPAWRKKMTTASAKDKDVDDEADE